MKQNMEDVLEREIENLKREEKKLERELMALTELSGLEEGDGLMDVNSLQATFVAADDQTVGYSAGASLGERGEQIREVRRRYQREANRAMRRYFDVVSDFSGYQARREKMLGGVRSFSFEARELQKSQRIRTRRMEEERRQRDQAMEQKLTHCFKASPVPPSTYMNKYDLMVEEWRERRAAVEALAALKAERMKRESEFMHLSAESLRQAREVMGVRNDEKKCRRAQSAGYESGDRRRVVELREVPLEVKLKLWPALEEHEQIRNERIKQRAAERLRELQAETIQRATFLCGTHDKKQQQQQQHQGAIVGVLPPHVPVVSLGEGNGAPSVTTTSPQLIIANNIPALDIATNTAVASHSPASIPPAAAEGGVEAVALGVQQSSQTRGRSSEVRKYNRNLTFKPKVRGGVPDFNTIWAENRLAMAERKRKPQPTLVQPFNITASKKDTIVRGRSAFSQERFALVTHTPQRTRSVVKKKQTSRSVSLLPEGEKKDVSKETRAQAIRVPTVASKNISKAERKEANEGTEDELEAIKEARRRQKMVSAKLKEYLKATHVNMDAVIKEKVRALRQRNREMEREAKRRLKEMQTRVAQKPPIFADFVQLNDIDKARLETEKEIMQMLKDSGVCDSTLAAILNSGEGAADNTVSTDPGSANLAVDIETKEVVETMKSDEQKAVVSSTKKEPETKKSGDSIDGNDDDSKSSSISTLSSLSGSSVKSGKQKDDYDDDFEDSSVSSTASV